MRWRIASTCCLLAYFVLHYWWYHKGVNGAESAPSGSLVQLSLWIASMSFMHIIVSLLVAAFNTSTDLISSSYLISAFQEILGWGLVFITYFSSLPTSICPNVLGAWMLLSRSWSKREADIVYFHSVLSVVQLYDSC